MKMKTIATCVLASLIAMPVVSAIESNDFVASKQIESAQVAELYQVLLQKLEVPDSLIKEALKGNANATLFVEPRLYLEVAKNGEVIWRSNSIEIKAGTCVFELHNDDKEQPNTFSLFFKDGDRITTRVFIAESKSLIRAERGAMGAGAVAIGAGIGATITGVLTGGLGALGGAGIGAGIGALFAGAAQLVPVKGAVEIAHFEYSSTNALFSRKEESPRRRGINEDTSPLCYVTFQGKEASDYKLDSGDLEQQKDYIVRLKRVYFSLEDKGVASEGRYYAILTVEGGEVKVDLGTIPANVVVPIELSEYSLPVLKNRLGVTKLEIYQNRNWWPDSCMFSAYQGSSDGSTWLFMGKLTSGKSWVEVETLGVKKEDKK